MNTIRIQLITCLSIVVAACNVSKKSTKDDTIHIELKDPVNIYAYQQPKVYNGSKTKLNDLIHTSLEVRFDWNKCYLFGKATLTFKPYFYPTNQLRLDAKGFDIKRVALINENELRALNYTYDKKVLNIELDRVYTKNEGYKIFIEYTAKPNELMEGGSIAITSDKGLFFINPDGKEKNKPKQIWTQGETEASSCWFPTIDANNERMRQEIFITVDKKYKTLSNGILKSSLDHEDGTRTDYWVQNTGIAPYLTMMAVGDFAVVKDKWRNLEVNYYVEPEYEPYARANFGYTPEMMEFFSKKLGVDYPWDKYSQVVVRDYVSGAMENVTATVFGEFMQKTSRELLDNDYYNEAVVSHELFHQWFGDLVTCESWANIPLNESFATYGEYIWNEYKYGTELADYYGQKDAENYFREATTKQVDLIRFDYNDREDMFDHHSYAKGGRILHMLRNYVGDDAFFESLKLYLTTNQYNSVEVHDLRLAFEKVTGEDLNWFFNEWFLAKGHPVLDIKTAYNDSLKKAVVTIAQLQNTKEVPLYRLPISVDIYGNGKKETFPINITKGKEDFYFDFANKPDLINVDGQKILLCKKEENKSEQEFAFQYLNCKLYLDRYEAINALAKIKSEIAYSTMLAALKDPFWGMRLTTVKSLDLVIKAKPEEVKSRLVNQFSTEENTLVRAAIIEVLQRNYKTDDVLPVFEKALQDSSYKVIAEALVAISELDKKKAVADAAQFENERNGLLLNTIASVYAIYGDDSNNDFFLKGVDRIGSYEKHTFIDNYGTYLVRMNNATISKGLPVMEDYARTEKTWYKRMIAIETLIDLQTLYNEREQSAARKLKDLYKRTAPAEEIRLTENDLVENTSQKEKVNEILRSLRETEKDENILKLISN